MFTKNNHWQATLVSPTEMGRFLNQTADFEFVETHLHKSFQINKIEDTRQYINFPLPPHRKTVYDFIFLTAGTTSRSKGIDTYNIIPNSFFFLPAYQILSSEYMSEDVAGFYCHFDIDIFTKKFTQYNMVNEFPFLQFNGNPIVKIPEEVTPSVLNILKRLEYEYRHRKPDSLDLICTYLVTLFYEVHRYAEKEDNKYINSASQITQRYKDALAEHIYTYHKASEYAHLLTVSPNYLNKCVKMTTGKSAHDVLSDVILLEAKALLKSSNLSISEIAYKIGKNDPSDFSRFFKAQTGMTPKKYRA